MMQLQEQLLARGSRPLRGLDAAVLCGSSLQVRPPPPQKKKTLIHPHPPTLALQHFCPAACCPWLDLHPAFCVCGCLP